MRGRCREFHLMISCAGGPVFPPPFLCRLHHLRLGETGEVASVPPTVPDDAFFSHPVQTGPCALRPLIPTPRYSQRGLPDRGLISGDWLRELANRSQQDDCKRKTTILLHFHLLICGA